MKKKTYLIIMIASLIFIIIELYFILIKPNLNKEPSIIENSDQSGYLNEMTNQSQAEHCTDRICTTIKTLSKRVDATEFTINIKNITSNSIGPGAIKLVSNDNESQFTIYFYDEIDAGKTTIGMCQHRLDGYETMSDYHIVELTDEEYQQEMSTIE